MCHRHPVLSLPVSAQKPSRHSNRDLPPKRLWATRVLLDNMLLRLEPAHLSTPPATSPRTLAAVLVFRSRCLQSRRACQDCTVPNFDLLPRFGGRLVKLRFRVGTEDNIPKQVSGLNVQRWSWRELDFVKLHDHFPSEAACDSNGDKFLYWKDHTSTSAVNDKPKRVHKVEHVKVAEGLVFHEIPPYWETSILYLVLSYDLFECQNILPMLSDKRSCTAPRFKR